METRDNQFLFVEKYRPQRLKDAIIPDSTRKKLQAFVEKGEIPHLLFTGVAGVGKTTIARILVNELNADLLFINASENGNIDTLRTTIRDFASKVSLLGGKKIIILDEADHLNAGSTQPALRAFMEEFAHNARFILTANYANRIIEPLKSRLQTFEFSLKSKDKAVMAGKFMGRCEEILTNEGITYDKRVLAEIVKVNFPDFRKTLNEIQKLSTTGTLDNDLSKSLNDSDVNEILGYMRDKEFTKMRKWVGEHADVDHIKLMRVILDNVESLVVPQSIPQVIDLYNEYDYRNAFVTDKETNVVVFMLNVMSEATFK